jgi:hypothetical protein
VYKKNSSKKSDNKFALVFQQDCWENLTFWGKKVTGDETLVFQYNQEKKKPPLEKNRESETECQIKG